MVYAVISDIDYSSGRANATGSIRLVNMGEIPQPEDVHGKSYDTYYHDATHFSDYEKAKANFELVKESYKDLDYSGIQFKEEAFREAKTAEQGDANAQPNVGSSSFIGQRVTQNDMTTISLFRR